MIKKHKIKVRRRKPAAKDTFDEFEKQMRPVLLTAWYLLVHALITGKVTRKELRRLEQAVATPRILIWIETQKKAKKKDRGESDPTVRKLVTEHPVTDEFLEQIVKKGFVKLVKETPAKKKKKVMRSIGALLHSDRLEEFIYLLYKRGLPEWSRIKLPT